MNKKVTVTLLSAILCAGSTNAMTTVAADRFISVPEETKTGIIQSVKSGARSAAGYVSENAKKGLQLIIDNPGTSAAAITGAGLLTAGTIYGVKKLKAVKTVQAPKVEDKKQEKVVATSEDKKAEAKDSKKAGWSKKQIAGYTLGGLVGAGSLGAAAYFKGSDALSKIGGWVKPVFKAIGEHKVISGVTAGTALTAGAGYGLYKWLTKGPKTEQDYVNSINKAHKQFVEKAQKYEATQREFLKTQYTIKALDELIKQSKQK